MSTGTEWRPHARQNDMAGVERPRQPRGNVYPMSEKST